MTVTNIREQLLRDEGGRLTAYRDTEGLLTIGVGRCLDRVPLTPTEAGMCGCDADTIDYDGLTITQEAAAMLLENDLRTCETRLLATLPWVSQLDGPRYGAMLNMAFNLGVVGLLGFKKFLTAMQLGQWKAAGIAMMDSKWAGQVGDRARRLRVQVETGEWT